MKNIIKSSYLSIILFIFTAWFAVFFFWNFIEYNNHLRGIFSADGLTFRGNEYEVVNFYMSNCAPYAFYALITGVLAWVLMNMRPKRIADAGAVESLSIRHETRSSD